MEKYPVWGKIRDRVFKKLKENDFLEILGIFRHRNIPQFLLLSLRDQERSKVIFIFENETRSEYEPDQEVWEPGQPTNPVLFRTQEPDPKGYWKRYQQNWVSDLVSLAVITNSGQFITRYQ